MFKTLKFKFSIIYIGLVLIIGTIGTFSTINNYKLSKQIDGLMVRNYKSIKAINNMIEAIDEQNAAVLTYIDINHEEGIEAFHNGEGKFNENYNIEANNITEPGEEELVKALKSSFEKYMTLFSELQETNSHEDLNLSIIYYRINMLPEFTHIKEVLTNISSLNENDMFYGKNKVTTYARHSTYIILLFSTLSVIIGFLVSMISLRRFLQPLYSLRETMKKVKEGDLNQQAPIISKDEIGDLTSEFNNMTYRLLQFEQSTLGQLYYEKTKSITIVKSIPDPLIVLDTNYKIMLLNNACENIFDIKEHEVLNKYFLEVIRNGDLYEYISSVYTSKAEHNEHKIMYLNIDNKDYYYNIIVSTLTDVSNSISGLVVLFQNVTQLKQIEKIKSNFIATISHEFKTPLTSIMIGTSLLSNNKISNLNTKQQEIISTITEDSEKLLTLVNDLLNLSKIESGKAIFNIKPHSVIDFIDTSIKAFSEQARKKSVYLHYELEDNLPKVNVDFEKVTWVLNNLISNALRYTSLGDEILINAFERQNKMCISVADTGIGIPQDYQEKIFDKFVQVPSEDTEIKGTGLGLAIAKEIIEALGGEIWCESTIGIGSTFIFTIPLVNFKEGEP